MEYEITPTLGPASQGVEIWRAMLAAGATGFRLNTSHLTLDELDKWLIRLRTFRRELGHFQRGQEINVSVTLDLQGSKWRLGKFDAFELEEGQRVELILADDSSDSGGLPVPHADFFRALEVSTGEVVLNDAKIRLAVEQVTANRASAQVLLGGLISTRKGISLPGTTFRTEGLSEKDRAIFAQAAGLDWVRFAVSYVRDGVEMENYRRDLPAPTHLTAKIERDTAVYDIMRIARICDSVWLCRGDLGAEIGLAGMAQAAARITAKARMLPKPLYLAGQVLEHMVAAPTPTRSEVCCIHDALEAGFRGLVLSDETAVGQYPVEAVRAAAMFKSLGG